VRITVKVQAGAKEEIIERIAEREFKVKVRPRAIDGQANEKVREVLARYFQIAKSSVHMFKGAKSKVKIFDIEISD